VQTQRGAVLTTRTKLVLLAFGITALDQLTKFAIARWIPEGTSRPVLDHILWFSDFRNPGAAFGRLKGFSGLLALAALVGVIAFLAIVVRDPGRWTGIGAAIVAGGALGNLIDRIARGGPINGSVVDFIDFHFWPAFNVADSAITVGAILILLAGFFEKRNHDAPERS
jgi:signal peptidase II